MKLKGNRSQVCLTHSCIFSIQYSVWHKVVSKSLYFKLSQRDKLHSDKSQKREKFLLAGGGIGAGKNKNQEIVQEKHGILIRPLSSYSPIISQPHLSFCMRLFRGRSPCLKTTFPRLPCQLGPRGNKRQQKEKSPVLAVTSCEV